MYIPPHCVKPCNPKARGTIIVVMITIVTAPKKMDHERGMALTVPDFVSCNEKLEIRNLKQA
jgi:hypothetical protein